MKLWRKTGSSVLAMTLVGGFMLATPSIASAAPLVTLNLLGVNDFHGRIDANTTKWAGTVEKLRTDATVANGGVNNTLFVGAGDLIGASLFASAIDEDQPTIDVMNALGLDASAVGNHEFDQGFADLTDRVIAGGANAQWDYLGANVYNKGTTTPALPEYALFTLNGITIGVVGAVTQETPSLVSPAGVANLDFGDPVAAVNRVAAQLSDGDGANGEAQIVIATFHDGAALGEPEGATFASEVAKVGSPFERIVNQLSPNIDVIFNGHTHKRYAWDAPIPGDPNGKTRPVLETGNYAEFVGQIQLVVDAADGSVVSYTRQNVARVTTSEADLIAAYPNVIPAVKAIVDAAIANGATQGNVPIGSVASDITTAYTGGTYVNGIYTGSGPNNTSGRDDRAKESSLSDLVANSLVASLSDPSRGGATIGVVNPGGLRAELFYAPDGVITYAEANGVLPFVNNLGTTTLTGEQFKTVLEQQWQTNPDGTIPTRPYLQLGLSDNVTYTFDPAAPLGAHITSVTVDGVPLDPAGTYRVGTFSFLLAGGDNFRIFASGTNTTDSGLVDRDAWIQFLTERPGIAPDFAENAAAVPSWPTAPTAGETITFAVSDLNLTSLGAPENTTLNIALASGEGAGLRPLSFASKAPVDADLGTVPVVGGAATVSVVLPATASGAHRLVLTAQPSGSVITLPLDIVALAGTSTTPTTPNTNVTPTTPTTITPTTPILSNTGANIPTVPLLAFAGLLLLIGSAFLLMARSPRPGHGSHRP